MQRRGTTLAAVFIVLCILPASRLAQAKAQNQPPLVLQNDHYRLQIDAGTGAITSFLIKATNVDMIGEPRLAANFRISLPLPDYQANYIDGISRRRARWNTKTTR